LFASVRVLGGRVRERIDIVVQRDREKALNEALEAEFELADKDEDGKLSREEFVKYIMKEDGFTNTPITQGSWLGLQKETLVPTQQAVFVDETKPQKAAVETKSKRKSSFGAAFLNSVAMIVVTELGDKTFFIAALMAMKHPRLVVFYGAVGALAVMTVLSAAIGFTLPNFLPRYITHYGAAFLFTFFGIKMLFEAYELYSSPTGEKNEELEQVEEQLNGLTAGTAKKKKYMAVLSQAFSLTFLAEWGDRSQIATIALSSSKDPLGVTAGGIVGHAFCTGLAVMGGRLLASRISEKQVALSGGILFCIFAIHSLAVGPAI